MVAWLPMRRPGVAVSIATALLLAALFAGDSVWTALAVLLVAGGWSALAFAGRAPQPGGGALLLGALLAIAAWAGLSVAWSVAPDRSWAELDRTLVFVAFLVVGLLVGASGPRACRWALAALSSALGAAVVWALAGKAIPALFPDGGRTARLRDPIGYWNALALAADVLLVLALELAVAARSRAALAAGSVLAYAAVVAVLLAASRAGVAAAVLGVALWLCSAAAGSTPPCSRSRPRCRPWPWRRGPSRAPALVDDGYPRADRVADGAWFGVLLLAGALVVGLAVLQLRRRPLSPAARRTVGRTLAGLAVVATLAVAVAAVANADRIADEFRGGEVTNQPDRFRSFSSNNRLDWWGEATGTSSGRIRSSAPGRTASRWRASATARPRRRVTQPHSVPLQFLAGLGLVGLALFAALVDRRGCGCGPVRAGGSRAPSGMPPRRCPSRSLLWLAHALVDYDWDFVAVTGPDPVRRRGPRRRRTTGAGAGGPAGRGRRRGRGGRRRRLGRHALAGRAQRARRRRRARPRRPRRRRRLGRAGAVTRPARARAALRPRPRRGEEARRRGGARDLPGGGAAPAGESGDLVRARPVRVPPRRPLLGVRPSERGVHARSGRHAVGPRWTARAGARVGERRETAASCRRSAPGARRAGPTARRPSSGPTIFSFRSAASRAASAR